MANMNPDNKRQHPALQYRSNLGDLGDLPRHIEREWRDAFEKVIRDEQSLEGKCRDATEAERAEFDALLKQASVATREALVDAFVRKTMRHELEARAAHLANASQVLEWGVEAIAMLRPLLAQLPATRDDIQTEYSQLLSDGLDAAAKDFLGWAAKDHVSRVIG